VDVFLANLRFTKRNALEILAIDFQKGGLG